MYSGYSNRHHGVPRSYTGSNDDCNLSEIDPIDEHIGFHRLFGHFLPCSFGRELDLASMDWTSSSGGSLPVAYIRDKIHQLMPYDWKMNYAPGVIRPADHHINETGYWARASAHLNNALVNQTYMTADALEWLKKGQHLKPASHGLREDAHDFFGGSTPAESFYYFLQARNGKGDHKWSKAFDPSIRAQLIRISRHVKPEPMRQRHRNELIDLLEQHRDDLYRCVQSWEPNPRRYAMALPPDMNVREFPRHLLRGGVA